MNTGNKVVHTKMYLCVNKESNYEHGVYLSLEGGTLRSFRHALYEVEFDVEVDVVTGDTKITHVDGRELAPKKG